MTEQEELLEKLVVMAGLESLRKANEKIPQIKVPENCCCDIASYQFSPDVVIDQIPKTPPIETECPAIFEFICEETKRAVDDNGSLLTVMMYIFLLGLIYDEKGREGLRQADEFWREHNGKT